MHYTELRNMAVRREADLPPPRHITGRPDAGPPPPGRAALVRRLRALTATPTPVDDDGPSIHDGPFITSD